MKIDTFFHNEKIMMLFSLWLVAFGLFLILSYFLADKNRFFSGVANCFILFSIIKRTKTILLSYAALAILIGLIGLISIAS